LVDRLGECSGSKSRLRFSVTQAIFYYCTPLAIIASDSEIKLDKIREQNMYSSHIKSLVTVFTKYVQFSHKEFSNGIHKICTVLTKSSVKVCTKKYFTDPAYLHPRIQYTKSKGGEKNVLFHIKALISVMY
jgi:hypothetical protein